MARRKKSSPYDEEAGRGTGAFDASDGPYDTVTADDVPEAAAPEAPSMRPPGPLPAVDGMPDSGLLGAVISVIIFFPIGIFALSAALSVRGKWKRGDRNGAREAAERADRLTYAAIGLVIVVAIVALIVYFVYWFANGRGKH
jgi:hypothetical protein